MLILAAAAFTLMPAIVSAQRIDIRPRFSAGDEFRLEVTRVRQRSRPPMNVTARTMVTVRVISAASDGTVLEWTPEGTEFDDPQVAQNPMVAAAAKAVSGIRFRLMLNADGEFTQLANEAEVMPKLQAIIDTMLQQLAANVPADKRTAFEAAMRQMVSPTTLRSGATTDAQVYLGLNGVALAPDEAVELRTQTPSPIGGGTIPSAVRIRMDSAAPESASLTTTTTYDADALRSLTAAMAKQVGKPMTAEELAKIPAVEMTDEGRYVFDRAAGLMREVEINRRIAAGAENRSDRWVIRLVTTPKP